MLNYKEAKQLTKVFFRKKHYALLQKTTVIILLLTALLAFTACGAPTSESVISDAMSAKVDKLAENYESLTTEAQAEVIETLTAKLSEIKSQYDQGKLESEAALSQSEAIGHLEELSDLSAECTGYIKEITNSKKNFEKAGLAEESKDLLAALKAYSAVSEKDKENYTTAQTKISELTKALEDSVILKVEKAQIVSQSSQWKSLYPDMIEAIVFNSSPDKTVKDFKIGFLAYDKNGLPIKIMSEYSFGNEDFEFIGTADTANILPQTRFGSDQGWSLDPNHGITTVIGSVKTVTFYDGTSWSNPLYDSWLEEHKEKPLQ